MGTDVSPFLGNFSTDFPSRCMELDLPIQTAMVKLMGGHANTLIGSSVYDMMADKRDLQKMNDQY
jgi:hypothetical protein